MKYTNKHNIPDEVIRALKNDNYSKGDADISATGLLQPPQIRILNNEHEDEITTDVSDRIWILLGTSVHNILEKANEGNPDVPRSKECMPQWMVLKSQGKRTQSV